MDFKRLGVVSVSDSELARVVKIAVAEALATLANSSNSDRLAYSIDDAAAATGLPRNTLRDAVSRGELPAVKRCGRWLIRRDALLRWLS